jgi:Holliday junction resolvasome RuvABC DNA-binding subunit
MIGLLRGKINQIENNKVLLTIPTANYCGIGYWINTLEKDKLYIEKESYMDFYIHTHTDYPTGVQELYGFMQYQDYKYFIKLLSIEGIGLAKALEIIESGVLDKVAKGLKVLVERLQTIKGIGAELIRRITEEFEKGE